MLKKILPTVAAICLLLLFATAASAHEHRDVEEYNFVVGFIQEPAFEGLLNAVSVRITKSQETESHGDHSQSESEDGDAKDGIGEMSKNSSRHEHGGVPVEGLESTLAVEVTHAPSGIKRQMALQPVRADAGHYTAYFIPTASGQYIFRFMGTIEGMQLDETFESGPGRFADIEPATEIQFPESTASTREVEAAVRGALESAQQAQDTALNARDTAVGGQNQASTATLMASIGIAVGAIGIIVGGISMVTAFRKRN